MTCRPARLALAIGDRYSVLFKHRHVRPAEVADAQAKYQVRWATIPLVFRKTRPWLAEERTHCYLAGTW